MMAMARGPLEEAAYALDYGQDRSTLSPEAQVMYDQLVMQDGEPRIGRLPGKEERKQAQQARRERLAVLHSSGVLDDDEFRAARHGSSAADDGTCCSH